MCYILFIPHTGHQTLNVDFLPFENAFSLEHKKQRWIGPQRVAFTKHMKNYKFMVKMNNGFLFPPLKALPCIPDFRIFFF